MHKQSIFSSCTRKVSLEWWLSSDPKEKNILFICVFVSSSVYQVQLYQSIVMQCICVKRRKRTTSCPQFRWSRRFNFVIPIRISSQVEYDFFGSFSKLGYCAMRCVAFVGRLNVTLIILIYGPLWVQAASYNNFNDVNNSVVCGGRRMDEKRRNQTIMMIILQYRPDSLRVSIISIWRVCFLTS